MDERGLDKGRMDEGEEKMIGTSRPLVTSIRMRYTNAFLPKMPLKKHFFMNNVANKNRSHYN